MGSIRQAIRELDETNGDAAKQLKGSLEMLVGLADAKKLEMKTLVNEKIRTAESRQEFLALFTLTELAQYHVISSNSINKGITQILNHFLSNAESEWKDEIKRLIDLELSSLLGGAIGASSTKSFYIVALDGKASNESYTPIRIDYCLWVYNYKKEHIINGIKSALIFYSRKSIIDMENIPNEMGVNSYLQDMGISEVLKYKFKTHLSKRETKKIK